MGVAHENEVDDIKENYNEDHSKNDGVVSVKTDGFIHNKHG